MIINSVIRGSTASQVTLEPSPAGSTRFKIVDVGENGSVSFTYTSATGRPGKAVYYFDGTEVADQTLASGQSYTWDATALLTVVGLHSLRVVAVDDEGSGTRLDFKVFYGYAPSDFAFFFSTQLNAYLFDKFFGDQAFFKIPELYDDGVNGERPVVEIDDGAFENVNTIVEVYVPSSVHTIGLRAFFSCDSLTKVTVNRETPPLLDGNEVFDPYTPLSPIEIYVPAASVNAYKAAPGWSEYANDISAIV